MSELTRIPTRDMSREEWLAARRKGIGGSDAGTIMGLNEYTSPYSLWCEKTGKVIPADISDRESVRLGNDLEDYVARRWMDLTGKKVHNDNFIRFNSDYPFALANCDRLVAGERAGLECKTTTSISVIKQLRNGEFPQKWYAQMTHYMAITGYDKWYLACMDFTTPKFYTFEIHRNQAEIDALMATEANFWFLVESDTPPAVDGHESTLESLKAVNGDSDGSTVDLSVVSTQLQIYNNLAKRIKELETEQAAAQAAIMEFMGPAEKGTFEGFTVNYKTQSRSVFDKKKYEAEHGQIPDEYMKASTSRPFKITVKKG